MLQKITSWFRNSWFYALALAATIAYAFKCITLDWIAFAFFVFSGIPIWVPTLARYIKALKKTEKGWELELKEDPLGLSAADIQQIVQHEAQIAPVPKVRRPFDQLSLHARRILKTLWHFQVQTFGENDARRWGFGVARSAPDFVTFSMGAKELEWDNYVYVDPRGLVYLTNEGIQLCQQNKEALNTETLYYQRFAPSSES